jgi:hypothetical protein
MILGIGKVHLHVQVILDSVHHVAVFSVAVCFSGHKSGIVAAPEDLIDRMTALFVLPSIHWLVPGSP